MSTVFVVDDDDSVRLSLTRMLRAEGFDVEAFQSGDEFLSRFEPTMRGCIVLDVSMPGIDGLELQSRLSGNSNGILPIVFLTGNGDIPMSVRAIKHGAADFLIKPVRADILLSAVRDALAKGEMAHRDRIEQAALLERFNALTPREHEVLLALVDGKINKQIADGLDVVEQTVKFHRARIMRKMRARTLAELMHMTARLGIGAANERGRRQSALQHGSDSTNASSPV